MPYRHFKKMSYEGEWETGEFDIQRIENQDGFEVPEMFIYCHLNADEDNAKYWENANLSGKAEYTVFRMSRKGEWIADLNIIGMDIPFCTQVDDLIKFKLIEWEHELHEYDDEDDDLEYDVE